MILTFASRPPVEHTATKPVPKAKAAAFINQGLRDLGSRNIWRKLRERTVVYLYCVQTVNNNKDVLCLPWHAIWGENQLVPIRLLCHAVRWTLGQSLPDGNAGNPVYFQWDPAVVKLRRRLMHVAAALNTVLSHAWSKPTRWLPVIKTARKKT